MESQREDRSGQLNIEIGADYPWCSVFMPFPGTELTQYAFDQGHLDPAFEFDSLSRSFFTDSKLNMPDIDRIANLQEFFQTAVLWPRVLPLVPVRNILVITNDVQAPEVRKQLPKLPKENVIAEPIGRDTCAAVTLGAVLVGARSTTGVMAVLPADHVILDVESFRDGFMVKAYGERFDRDLVALVRWPWKLIASSRGATELYRLDVDPHELDDRGRRGRVAELRVFEGAGGGVDTYVSRFTIPKRLRVFFKFVRRRLGDLTPLEFVDKYKTSGRGRKTPVLAGSVFE